MGLEEVANIIGKIAEGFEEACMKCLENNSDVVLGAIKEQLYSGLNGDEQLLSPNYLEDEYFTHRTISWFREDELTGKLYIGAQGYVEWKMDITPPETGQMLGLPMRPAVVPNLFIDGSFYSELTARRVEMSLMIDPGVGNGPAIVDKYGDEMLDMGPTAKGYFNENFMLPAIDSFFKICGYK